MNIKHGDIITLKDGTKAKVSLEIMEKVTELTVNSIYELEHNGQFCHIISNSNTDIEINTYNWIYIGKITTPSNESRNIFYAKELYNSIYCMFSDKNLDFVIKKVK